MNLDFLARIQDSRLCCYPYNLLPVKSSRSHHVLRRRISTMDGAPPQRHAALLHYFVASTTSGSSRPGSAVSTSSLHDTRLAHSGGCPQ
eukprot:389330-Pleurochrysis_carterae.AAC.3